MTEIQTFDIIIVGAGPAGLAFARGLDGSGLNIAIVERQTGEQLGDPAPDGREIALTQRSINTLRDLGAWELIDPADIAPLRAAFVLNGTSPFALSFDRDGPGALGQLVPNHLIRRALHAVTAAQPGLTMITGASVAEVHCDRQAARVTLADGRELTAKLLVAADSRLSQVRKQLGIAADIQPAGQIDAGLPRRTYRGPPGRRHRMVRPWPDHRHAAAERPPQRCRADARCRRDRRAGNARPRQRWGRRSPAAMPAGWGR